MELADMPVSKTGASHGRVGSNPSAATNVEYANILERPRRVLGLRENDLPRRPGPLDYRFRSPASHAGEPGSIPGWVTNTSPGGGTGRHR